MNVRLRLVQSDEKPAIADLLASYLEELGALGYGADYPLDAYFGQSGHWPYFIEADGARAGFALINALSISGYPVDAAIAEFFVSPKFRRKGCGEQAAFAAFASRPGRWELSFRRENAPARAFWPKVVERAGARGLEAYKLMRSEIWRFHIKSAR